MFIEIPKSLVCNRKDDAVSYEMDDQGYTKIICYSSAMPHLETVKLLCKPYDKSLLPKDYYMKFFDLCKQNKLIHNDIVYYHDNNNNYMLIPSEWKNRKSHLVYIALCCYRFADAYPPMIYELLKILENNPKLHFFQVFHYVSSKYVIYPSHGPSIHSFILATSQDSNLYNYYSWKNLALSAVLPYNLEKTSTERQTNIFFAKLSDIINPRDQNKTILLDKKEDALKEELAPIFGLKELTSESFRFYFS